ncbi:hypothetical protein [[Flexibacter] sp. ATCC 35208]|uniref:hypothetical protein n=1 Tax=[Flexibacter] sp. ATCC 35208 TaxID=1936242 RepID=UPI0009C5BE58|nr:hypothetical protein [[Flexibacter] sp. ATCC 35208]OMP75676.1 hypothetical protein BW716_28800 [[Flexibacter] sp. ATCC 35208]
MPALQSKLTKLSKPSVRKLRAYAFDPSLSLTTDMVDMNIITYKVEWEDLDPADPPAPSPETDMSVKPVPGYKLKIKTNTSETASFYKTVPAGEYIEIIDYDPASAYFYSPVDLNDPFLLAQDGLNPSVSNPQFHQQMVYAVVMTTIKNFERALGRKIQWSPHLILNKDKPGKIDEDFVERLRIYPHALRQANAYYNPYKKSLLFGYFPAKPANIQLQLPGGTVFTCLSHDIIAHETTHAILDGLRQRFIEDTHPDTRAFHEAFADLVALFQHFSFPEVLRHQISRTRGDLASQNLLGQLAQQFGKALGGYSSLRDAIGHNDPDTGEWIANKPDPDDYVTKMEFHDRGAILVAAIFDAFLTIYKQRIRIYLRVASDGSGILREGELHPDMVELLSATAADTASRVLRICVRALDYCPPVDINFGDYLRAIITADADMVPYDEKNYRVAFIEAFQKRGIYPIGVKTMSVESLIYEPFPELNLIDSNKEIFIEFLRRFKEAIAYETDRETIFNKTKEFIAGGPDAHMGLYSRINQKFIMSNSGDRFGELSGLLFPMNQADCDKMGLNYSARSQTATYAVDNLWLASRITPADTNVNHVIVTLVQKRGIIAAVNEDDVFSITGYFNPSKDVPPNGFVFRGGCTLIFDLDKLELKYAVKKDIDDVGRIEQQFRYTNDLDGKKGEVYFSNETLAALSGPFAFMHSFNHQLGEA